MTKQKSRPVYKDIDSYIKDQTTGFKTILKKVRETIRKAVPDSEEVISYGIPAFRYHGILIFFAAFKNHYSIFIRPQFMQTFKTELTKYKLSKSAINIPYNVPVPVRLITKIAKHIAAKNLENEIKKSLKKKSSGT